MSITLDPKTEQAVAEEVRKAADDVRYMVLRNLHIAGVESVNVARSVVTENGYLGSGMPYTVQSGNLTSSVGYCITEDGKIVEMSSFEAVKGKKDSVGTEGAATGRKLAMQIAREFPQGYALILVAGMHYASYVQELHHRDVLLSGELVAARLIDKLKAKLARTR